MPPTRTHLAKGYGYTTAGGRTADTTHCGRPVVDATLVRSMDTITCTKCAHEAAAYLRITREEAPYSLTAWGHLCREVERREANILYAVELLDEVEQRRAAYAAGDKEVRVW